MGTWTNEDGLPIEYGTSQATPSTGGDPHQSGGTRKLIVDIDLTTLSDANAAVGYIDSHELPKGAIINSAVVDTLVGAVSVGSATLDLGIIKTGTAGTDDPDGFDVDIAKTAIDTAGERVVCDGALIGTVLDAQYRVSASYETEVFSAGKVRLTIEYTNTLNREDQ